MIGQSLLTAQQRASCADVDKHRNTAGLLSSADPLLKRVKDRGSPQASGPSRPSSHLLMYGPSSQYPSFL